MGVKQINPSRINKFRNILYKTSSGTFGTGNLISLNVYQQNLRGIRRISLTSARLTSDIKAITPGGQGLKFRVGRRIGGRAIGKIGQTLIPQNLGFASRMANNFYGRYAGRELQQFFNKKVKIESYINGYQMTEAAKTAIMLQPKMQRQFAAAKTGFSSGGVSVHEYNPLKLLFSIQAYMIGLNQGGMAGAPIESGNLIDSINLRGFTTNDPEGLVVGKITVGSSEGNEGDVADQAPYWWKTIYGGAFYDLRKFGIPKHSQWINAKKPYWWGHAVKMALASELPKKLLVATKHIDNWNYEFRPQSALTPKYLQPGIPKGGWKSFELSAENVTKEDRDILRNMGYQPGLPGRG